MTLDDLDDGVGYAREVGFETVLERGRLAAAPGEYRPVRLTWPLD